MGHNYWAQISVVRLTEHISKNKMFACVKKELNAVKLQEVIFQKSQILLASRARSSAQTKASTAVT